MTHYLCQLVKVIHRLTRKHIAQFHADRKNETVYFLEDSSTSHPMNIELFFPAANIQPNSMVWFRDKDSEPTR